MTTRASTFRSARWVSALLVLLIGGLITWLAAGRAAAGYEALAQTRFDHAAANLRLSVAARLKRPRYGLGGFGSVIAAVNKEPSVEQFRQAVAARDLPGDFPGVLGFGYIVRVAKHDLPAFLAREQAEYGKPFPLKTSGSRDDLLIVRAIEPAGANDAALGVDAGAEPMRRATIERASTSGELAISAPLHLVQTHDGSFGALYVAPAYVTAGGTKVLAGWVYAAVHYPGLLAEVDSAASEVAFHLEDVTEPAAELIYRGDSAAEKAFAQGRFRKRVTFDFGGRTFALTAVSKPIIDSAVDLRWPLTLSALGAIISLLASIATWLLVSGRERAVAMARSMTSELDRLAMVARLTMDGVAIADRNGKIVWTNPAFCETRAMTPHEAIGRPIRGLAGDIGESASAEGDWSLAIEGKGSFHGECVRKAADRSLLWLETEIQPIVSKTGQLNGLVLIEANITARRAAEARLQESEAFLDRTGKAAGVGGWQVELSTRRLTWSTQTRRIHEVPDHFVPDMENSLNFYPPGARERLEEAVTLAIATGKGWDLELPFLTHRGNQLWVRAMGFVEFHGERPVRLTGAFQDITSRKHLELDLERNRELLRVTLNSIGDAVVTTDAEGTISWMNPVAERLSGWTTDEAAGRPITDVLVLSNEETRRDVANPVYTALKEAKIVGLAYNTVMLSRDGTEYGVDDSAAPIFDAFGKILGAVMVFHDVTEARAINRELVHHARHDVLTGLPNRIEFEVRASRFLKQLQAQGGRGVVMFIDLDHFKIVNDTCGHFAGDELLRQVSSIIRSSVRSFDTVARLGGDEFAILLEDCSSADGRKIAQEICDAVDHYRFVAADGQRFRVGTSIGVASTEVTGGTLEQLLQAADSACYAAKMSGRHRYHFWTPQDGGIQTQAGETAWGVEVERALDEKAFELYAQLIQPRSPRATATVRGLSCEILVRMRMPDQRVVSPTAFMQAAERYQLAGRIDRWVVQSTFDLLSELPAALIEHGHIGINLSGQSVGDAAFHEFVKGVVSRATFDVRCVCFEITETAAITNITAASGFLKDLRRAGIKVALDDFGAGVSSFGYLKTLQVDYLKIDGQFVKGVIDSPIDLVSVRSFCDVAEVLGLQTIAEYVEDEGTLRVLEELEIDLVQGFHVHVPQPVAELVQAMTRARMGPLNLRRNKADRRRDFS